MIPLLALGIPFAPPAAVLLAGLRMHNVNPGPFLFDQAPALFWGFIASMYIGNFLLLVLNLPLVGFFARIATLRPKVLMPIVSVICLVGVYSVRNSLFDIGVMIVLGILGFFLRKWKFPIAALVIGLVLGPMMETSFRQTVMSFESNYRLILERPIVLGLLLVMAVFMIINQYRKSKFPEG